MSKPNVMVEAAEKQEQVVKEIRTAVKHSTVYGLGSMLAKALGFLMIPFYTSHLTPADYGILEILDLSMSLLGMFLNMGMTAALLRSYTAAHSAEEKRTVVSTAVLFVVSTAVLTLLAALAMVRPVTALLFGDGVPPAYLLLSLGSLMLGYVANLPRTYLRALEASGRFVLVETVALFVTLALNVYFIAVMRLGLVGILLSSIIVGFLQAVLLCGWTVYKVGIGLNMSRLQEMLRFGLPLVFSNLSLFTLNFADRFFLQHLRSVDAVGIYAVGYKFAFMINFLLVQPFYVMWQSRMYIIHKEPEHPKIFGQIFVLYSVLLTFAALGLSVFSPEIVAVMVDAKFASSQSIIPLVALAYVFYGIGYYVQLGAFLTNKTKVVGTVSLAAAVLNLILNYFLILYFGEIGAAWATLLSFLGLAVGSYWFSHRAYPLPLHIGRVAAGIGLALVLYMFSRSWNPGSLPAAVAVKTLLLAAFPLFMWRARILSRGEIETIASAKNAAMGRVLRVLRPSVREA